MAGRGEPSGKDYMAVEDGPGRVGDGVVHVVAFDEHGVQARYTADFSRPGALQKARHEREDRRRVASGSGRFARGQTDLALGHAKPGQAVHHQHDVAAAVPEPFRDPGRRLRGLEAHEGGLVRSSHHDHGPGQSGRPQVVLDHFPDLTAALAHQSEDRNVRLGAAGDH